jgi:hypothetical protein
VPGAVRGGASGHREARLLMKQVKVFFKSITVNRVIDSSPEAKVPGAPRGAHPDSGLRNQMVISGPMMVSPCARSPCGYLCEFDGNPSDLGII